jgi:mannitol-1-/sugar-/sorbitol-6-/2-deoxyglucose-6-phosphatase
MIEAVIFDLDGVIVDSEPLWTKGEQRVLKTVGLDLTDEMCELTKGFSINDTINFWYSRKPWTGKSLKEVGQEVLKAVMELIALEAVPVKGMIETLGYLSSKGIKTAVASGSPLELIYLVLEKFEIKDKFNVIRSCNGEEFPKPHPAVYLSTAGVLKTNPLKCLVFEDTFTGLLAAKSARMKAIALLEDADKYNNSKFDFADVKIRSFSEFDEQLFQKMNE